jgi:hypothetical protein
LSALGAPPPTLVASPPPALFLNPEKAGSSAIVSVTVPEDTGWTACLLFVLPKGYSPTDSQASTSLKLVREITGGPGQPERPHRGIQLSLTVKKKENGQEVPVKSRSITDERMYTSNQMTLDGFRLAPGEYVVTAQMMSDDDRLSGIPIALSVRTKPFTTTTPLRY